MKTHVCALAIGLAVVSAAGAEQVGKVVEDPYEGAVVVDPAKVAPGARGYSPYAGRKYPTRRKPIVSRVARKSSHPRVCRPSCRALWISW